MKKENIYIDPSKCTEEQRKSLPNILQKYKQKCTTGLESNISPNDIVHFHKDWNSWALSLGIPDDKTELTYPDFIKLFEGGEDNNGWISIEKDWPKEEGEYLTYQKSNDSMSVNYCDTEQWGYYHTPDEVPTYWMPLPEPPKF